VLLVESRHTAVLSTSTGKVVCEFFNLSPLYYGAWRGKTAFAYTLPSVVEIRGKSVQHHDTSAPGGYHDAMCLAPDGRSLFAFVDGALQVTRL